MTNNQLDRFVEANLRARRLPGLALAIVRAGQVVHLRGYGVADPTGRPVTPETPFVIGSLSKSFTALAIMQLVEAGKVDLDAPVQRYLPWFRLRDLDASALITVRHLLTHISGISTYTGRELLAARGGRTMEHSVRELRTVRLTAAVGARYQYSNTNYAILGLLVQVVAGCSYEQYIEVHIFAPLLMGHSFTRETSAAANGLATGYRWWFGLPIPVHAPFLPDALPAAFIMSSATDMARYLLAHLAPDAADAALLLSASGFAELHRPQTMISQGVAYALGWRVMQLHGQLALTHTGETANYRAEMIALPGDGLGLVILTNCNNGAIAQLGLDRLGPQIVDLLQGRQPVPKRFSFQRLYLTFDSLALLLLVLSAWSLLKQMRLQSHAQLSPWRGLWSLLWQLIVPLAVIATVPRLCRASWRLLLLYVPDVSSWLLSLAALSLTAWVVLQIKS